MFIYNPSVSAKAYIVLNLGSASLPSNSYTKMPFNSVTDNIQKGLELDNINYAIKITTSGIYLVCAQVRAKFNIDGYTLITQIRRLNDNQTLLEGVIQPQGISSSEVGVCALPLIGLVKCNKDDKLAVYCWQDTGADAEISSNNEESFFWAMLV